MRLLISMTKGETWKPRQPNKHRRSYHPSPLPSVRIATLLPVMVTLVLVSSLVLGQQCPGGPPGFQPNMTSPTLISASSMTTAGPIAAFIGGGCTMTMMGGPTAPNTCLALNSPGSTPDAVLFAGWLGAGGSKVSNYCVFSGCAGGTCIIRGADGLPVELLDFYIEESGDTQSEGRHGTEDRTTEDGTVSKP